jgi:predicted DNA-binding transcriptional regulator AlpA
MEKLLSAAQVADHLGIHVKTLYKQLRENKIAITYVQLQGKTIAFRPSEIERFLRTREVRKNGSGLKATRTKAKKVSLKIPTRLMTGAEAQEFFANVARDEDGTLLCDPDSFEDK